MNKIIIGTLKKANLHRNKLLLLLIVIFASLTFVYSNKSVVKVIEKYDNLSNAEIGNINDSQFSNKEEYLESSEHANTIGLKNNQKLTQIYRTPMQEVNEITIFVNGHNQRGNVTVTLSGDTNKLFEEKIAISTIKDKINFLVNKKFALDTKLNLTLSVSDLDENDIFEIFTYKNEKNFYTVDEISPSIQDKNVILSKTIGTSTYYHFKFFSVFAILTLITFSLLIASIINSRGDLKNKILLLIEKIENKKLVFIFEFVLVLSIVLLFLRFIIYYFYYQQINMLLLTPIIIFGGIFIYFFIVLLKRYKNEWDKLFLLLAIPIGIGFLVLMVPDSIPDEPVHFYKTVLTANFDFSKNTVVQLPSNYVEGSISNLNELWNSLFTTSDYSSALNNATPVSYCFILYIIPSIGIMFAKLFSLSIYMGYFLAKMLNLILFLYLGYKTIKITPYGKVVFFVYLFNPMILHQAVSVSADVLINALCILFIAYVMNIKFREDKINNKDIIIFVSFILFILVSKYVYLPICCLIFIVFDKLKDLDKKKIILFFSAIMGALIIYILYNYLGRAPIVESAGDLKVADAIINPTEQIKYLLSNPFNIFYLLYNTIKLMMEFYVFSFFGRYLSWLNWHVSSVAIYLYIFVFFLSPFILDEKKKLKITSKIWAFILSVGTAALVIVGLYLTWTGVGEMVAQGVQGRYFIPFAILLLLVYSGKRRILVKNPAYFLSALILVIHIIILSDLLVIVSGIVL